MIKYVLLLSLFAFGSATNIFSRQHYEANYQEWRKTFKDNGIVPHEDGDDYVRKLDIFADNSDVITKHNKENHSWTMAHNEFSDMSAQEFKEKFIPENMPTDFLGQLEIDNFEGADTASSIDWEQKGCVTSVKRQMCGDCWSFASAGALEGARCVNGGSLVDLSSQQLVDCDKHNHGCRGGFPWDAFTWVAENGGMCSLEDYPYGDGHEGECQKNCSPAKGTQTLGYKMVDSSDDAMMAAVSQQPVAIGVASRGFSQLYHSGVFNGDCNFALDHAVLVVGYGTTDGGDDFYRVKNSWGTSWGEGGYIRFARGKNGDTGACGMLTRASYPDF